jgi:hypothetical protein
MKFKDFIQALEAANKLHPLISDTNPESPGAIHNHTATALEKLTFQTGRIADYLQDLCYAVEGNTTRINITPPDMPPTPASHFPPTTPTNGTRPKP